MVTDLRRRVRRVLEDARRRTRTLLAPLGEEDLHRQFVPILSPLVWDVGHIANVEERWLLRVLHGHAAHDPRLDELYDPFAQPRPVRGRLPLPDHDQARHYAAEVRAEVLAALDRTEFDGDDLRRDGYVFRMVAQHEAQHQETMLQALDLRVDLDPYPPAAPRPAVTRRRVDDEERIVIPGGPFTMGTDDRTWAYDNERPAHTVEVATFAIDRYPATNRRYAAFIADGGYQRPELWSEEGWSWRERTGHTAPQGWEPDGEGGWRVRRFGYLLPLDPAEPVQHLSYYEAEAFARWAGGRLPTEAEWEKAARHDPATGRSRRYPWGEAPPTPDRANVGLRRFGPAPVGSFPRGASAYGVEQLVGDVYEWTASPFVGYPGFRAFPYREYSEVFFGDTYRVLRGASWAIAAPMARATYRNWDLPQRRQIFAGVRVAWDPS